MRRALAAAALMGGLIGFAAGAGTSGVLASAYTYSLFRTETAVVECLNWGEGELRFEQIREDLGYLECKGPQLDRDGDLIPDREERARRHRER